MEETFQSHLINTTIFQTKSFDVLSEFALLISCATCSAYSSVRESEKMSQQKRKYLYHLNKFECLEIFSWNRTTALLTVLSDQYNVIMCISSAYKFKKMDADKIKKINLIEIGHPPAVTSIFGLCFL